MGTGTSERSDALDRNLLIELGAALERVRQLERANAELTQFAYVAAHDLQSPLRKLLGFSDLLERRCLDAEGADLAARIAAAAARMSGLVDSILSLARVTSNPAPLQREPLDPIVDDALLELESSLESLGARVERRTLPAARVDRLQVGQLVRNLLSNAMKYRSHERPLVVRIGPAGAPDGMVAFCVEDNGIGIPEADRPGLFRPFYRSASGRRVEGYGLGLALCAKIAQRHGGAVALDASRDGCRFVVSLPEGGLP